MATPSLEIITLPVAALRANSKNVRTHPLSQVAQIAASVKEFGFTNPLLVDEDDMVIAGHGRLDAAKEIGLKEVPCIRLSWLTDEQKRAYAIADNQIALNSGWDIELLSQEIRELESDDFNLDLTGLGREFIDEVLGEIEDIEIVDHFNEKFSVSIECDDMAQYEAVRALLGISGKKIKGGAMMEKLIENSTA